MTRRRALVVTLTAALVLGSTLALAVTYDVTVQGQPVYKTDDGLEVQLPPGTDIQSGNPFGGPESVTLRQITYSASGAGSVELASNSSAWTNVTNVDATQSLVGVDAPSKPEVKLGGAVYEASISGDLDETSSGDTDLTISANGQGRVLVDTGGSGAVAVNADTGAAIDDGTVFPNGTVAFDIPATGTYPIDLQPAPSRLFIYDESEPSELIDGSASLRVRFFVDGREEVIERTVTDGTVDLSGLPSDSRFVVTVRENESDFTYRRTIIESLTEQQEIYLLPDSQPSVDVEFRLQDFSGLYDPSGTTLFIESPITKDFDNDGTDETRYQTIAGDNFGAAGSFPATLRTSERYRLRIVNDPNERVLGSYTASVSQVETIRIQGLQPEVPDTQGYATNTTVFYDNGQRYLTFKFSDESTDTSRFDIEVYERNNPSNVTLDATQTNGPIEEYAAYRVPLRNDTRYVLNWSATRGGDQIGAERIIGGTNGPTIPLDSDWLGTAALVMITFIGSLAGRQKATYIAISVVSVAGVLMWLRAIDILAPLWWLAAVVAIGGHLRHIQSPGEP